MNIFRQLLDTKDKVKEIKRLEDRIKSLTEEMNRLKESHEDILHKEKRNAKLVLRDEKESCDDRVNELIRYHSDEEERLQKQVEKVEDLAKKAIDEAKSEAKKKVDEAQQEIFDAKSENTRQIEDVKSQCKADVQNAKVERIKEYESEIKELKKLVDAYKEEAARSNSRSEERADTIESLKGQIEDYKEFVQFALGKLPNVDLSKFNINVDVPASDVNIINAKKSK